MKKMVIILLIYVVLTVLLLPAGITFFWSNKKSESKPQNNPEVRETDDALFEVPVTNGQIVEVPKEKQMTLPQGFEDYIHGVVSAEMPALFHQEALKAQAVAARTYAVRKMLETGDHGIPYDIGQAYLSLEERKKRWGEHFDVYEEKIKKAVKETEGMIMVYEQAPILAVFHGESGGMTENSENVWQREIPYLKSVDSSVDEQAPGFEKETKFSCQEVVQALKKKSNTLVLEASNLENQLIIQERSQAGYILKIQVGNELWSGGEVRAALGLRSANFTFHQQGEEIIFTTKGHGHGAGMSQYGAEFMAQEGKTYQEILQHYYSGITFAIY